MGKFDSVLICSDVDGTLAEGPKVFEENKVAIRHFISEGGKFCVCTGRGKDYIPRLEGLSYNAPFISMNGTIISDCFTGENLLSIPLEEDLALKIVFDYNLSDWPKDTLLSIWSETTRIGSYVEVPKNIDYLKTFGTQNQVIQKLVFGFKDRKIAADFKEWAEKRYPEVVVCRSWWEGVEIINKNAGKGVCLKWLKEHLGCKIAIGIGDQENDISMLKAADLAFCPQNATEDVKKISNQVLCDFRDSAIANLISILPNYIKQC